MRKSSLCRTQSPKLQIALRVCTIQTRTDHSHHCYTNSTGTKIRTAKTQSRSEISDPCLRYSHFALGRFSFCRPATWSIAPGFIQPSILTLISCHMIRSNNQWLSLKQKTPKLISIWMVAVILLLIAFCQKFMRFKPIYIEWTLLPQLFWPVYMYFEQQGVQLFFFYYYYYYFYVV